jgi:hypothetical protein
MVKIEDQIPQQSKAGCGSWERAKFKNEDLPAGCQDEGRWHKIFIPTYIIYLSSYKNGWVVGDMDAVNALQKNWKAVYRDEIPYTIEVNDAVHAIICSFFKWNHILLLIFLQAEQRACDSWCSTIGSTALASVLGVLQKINSDKKHREFAKWAHANYAFVYSNTESENPDVGISYLLSISCWCCH